MTDSELARLADLTASAVSDALDRLGIAGQCSGIMPLDRSFRLVGRAWTLRYGPAGHEPGSVGDYIDELGPGQVVVLDNQSRLDVTVWGDLLTTTASARGVAGTLAFRPSRSREMHAVCKLSPARPEEQERIP
jgi:4-hydroxy-4-methyl-2-oxoglutarate aldolase